MAELVFEIPGKLTVSYHAQARTVIDTWTSYAVSLSEFKDAVLKHGMAHFVANKGRAWIVDSSQAKSVFSQEIQECIGTEVFPAFARSGVKYFITITSQSATTRMSISSYQAKTGPNGLQLVEMASQEDAVAWLLAQP